MSYHSIEDNRVGLLQYAQLFLMLLRLFLDLCAHSNFASLVTRHSTYAICTRTAIILYAIIAKKRKFFAQCLRKPPSERETAGKKEKEKAHLIHTLLLTRPHKDANLCIYLLAQDLTLFVQQ